MSKTIVVVVGMALCLATAGGAAAQDRLPGTQEFGLSERELVEKIEAVEPLIAKCMREQGFQYVAVDSKTVRKGTVCRQKNAGPQREGVHGPARLRHLNVLHRQIRAACRGVQPSEGRLTATIILNLQEPFSRDRVAYNRALLGENTNPTFAVALEIQDSSQTGGCTRTAIAQVFTPEQLQSTYYNPKDALVNKDPRMKAAVAQFAAGLRKAG